jgi:hypothetical protein
MTWRISAIHVLTDLKCSQDVNVPGTPARKRLRTSGAEQSDFGWLKARVGFSGSSREPSQHRIEGQFDALDSRRLVGKFVVLRVDQHRGIDLEHHDIS